jgi:hypothetical protein
MILVGYFHFNSADGLFDPALLNGFYYIIQGTQFKGSRSHPGLSGYKSYGGRLLHIHQLNRCFQAIHLRHANIQENNIYFLLLTQY